MARSEDRPERSVRSTRGLSRSLRGFCLWRTICDQCQPGKLPKRPSFQTPRTLSLGGPDRGFSRRSVGHTNMQHKQRMPARVSTANCSLTLPAQHGRIRDHGRLCMQTGRPVGLPFGWLCLPGWLNAGPAPPPADRQGKLPKRPS